MDLTPERYEQLQALFEEASALHGPARDAFLEGVEPVLVGKLRELLGAGDSDLFSEGEIEAQRAHMQALTEGPASYPKAVGPFRILRCVGEGGMGAVFEAEQAKPRRRVALKVLRSMLASPARVARFEREAEWLGRLHHPGIAQVYDAGTFDQGHGQQPYLAMEFVDGPDLITYAARAGLSTPERLRLLAGVCDAVHHAHEAAVLHRDLKPDNVLVDPHGQPKLLDFGISRALEEDETLAGTLTTDGQILGTLGYMAPEQLDPKLGELGPPADVYALGVIGYELLTGRRPINTEGLSFTEVLRLLSRAEPPAPSAIEPRLRGEVDIMLTKALAREPGRRYASAAAFGADLWRHLDDLPIHARPPSRIYRLRKYVRRQKGVVAVLAALLLGLIGTLGFALDARERGRVAEAAERRERDANATLARTLYAAESRLAYATASDPSGLAIIARHVERWRERPPGEVELGWEFELLEAMLDEPCVQLPATDTVRSIDVHLPSGRLVAGAPEAIEVRALDDGRLLRSFGPVRSQVLDIAFSPDGRRAVATFLFGPVTVWDVESGELLWSRPPEDDPASCVAWSRDPDLILRGGFATPLQALDPDTGDLVWTGEEFKTHEAQGLALAPDGERCAISDGYGITVGVVTVQGIERVGQIDTDTAPTALAWSPDGMRIAHGHRDGRAGVSEVDSGERLVEFQAHSGLIVDVDWSQSGDLVATASWDRSSLVWDGWDGIPIRRYRDLDGHNHRAQWIGASRLAVTGDWPSVNLWRWAQPGPLVQGWLRERGHAAESTIVARGDGGLDAMCGATQFDIDLPSGALFAVRRGPAAWALSRSRDGTRLARVLDERLHLEPALGDGAPASYPVGPDRAFRVRWSPAGPERVAVACFDNLSVLDLESPQELRTLLTFGDCYTALAWSPDGRELYLGCSPQSVHRIDPGSGEILATLPLGCNPNAVAPSPDGRTLAVGTSEHDVLLLDARTLETRQRLQGHTDEVLALCWHPDGTRLASGGYDRVVRIWDPERGEMMAALDVGGAAGEPDLDARRAVSGRRHSLGSTDLFAASRAIDLPFAPSGILFANGP